MSRKFRTIIYLIPTIVMVLFFVLANTSDVQAAALIWDGGGTDGTCGGQAGDGNKWSCAANWSTDLVPGSGDTITFNGTSTKNVTVDSAFAGTINSLSITSGYTGTITLGRSLSTLTTFSQAAGTFNGSSQTLTIGSSFSLTAGNFTAPSATMQVASGFTISGSPTFSANGGTVNFNGTASGTIACNNTTFNLVTITNSAGTKTINSNCSLPLGANPAIGSGGVISLSGGLSGSGTITFGGGLTNNASTASLSGFSGIVVSAAFINQNSTTLDLGAYTTATFSSFTLSSGSFTAPSTTMTVSSTFTLSGGTFNANGGTITFNGAGATLSCNNVVFAKISFTHTSSTKVVSSNCSLPLGANPTVGIGGGITNNGTLSGSGALTVGGAYTHNAVTATLTGFSGLVVNGNYSQTNNAVLNLSTYTLVDFNGTSAASGFVLSSGTFTAPSGIMTVAAGFTVTGGTFNANGGTMTLDGASLNATLACNNTVFNKVIFSHSASTITTNADCNIPLGANPTIPNGTINNGTLSGSGTLHILSSSGSFTWNTGSALSGFTGLDDDGSMTISGATLDFSNYSFFDIDIDFTLTSGSFTAAPGTMFLGRNLTITGGTFIANNGTLTLDSNNTGTLSCNNVAFNLVTIDSLSAKIINSNCSLPLGANPSLRASGGITLSGSLSGSGTLTISHGFKLNAGATLSGFTGLVDNLGTFTIQGASLNLSDYSLVDLDGSFALSAGTVIAPAGTMTIGGSLTFTGGTFDANNGTITFDGTTANTISCNNATFHLITFAHSINSKTINSDCTLPLGANPVLGSDSSGLTSGIFLNGTFTGTGLLTINGSTTFSTNAGLSGFTSLVVRSLVMSGATLDLSSYSTVRTNTGSFLLNSGTFTAPPVMEVDLNWINLGGIFNSNSGKVIFSGTTDHSIIGSTTFNSVTQTQIGGTLSFSAGSTQTIVGALILQGSADTPLSLRSLVAGSQWKIDPQGPRFISHVTVSDANNINSTPIALSETGSIDDGNNIGWDFTIPSLVIDSFSSTQMIGVTITQARPTFSWNEAQSNSLSAIDHYSLTVEHEGGIVFSLDTIPADEDAYGNSLYLFNKADQIYSLTTKSSADWPENANDGKVPVGVSTVYITAHDELGNTTIIQQQIVLTVATDPAKTTVPSESVSIPVTSSPNSVPGEEIADSKPKPSGNEQALATKPTFINPNEGEDQHHPVMLIVLLSGGFCLIAGILTYTSKRR